MLAATGLARTCKESPRLGNDVDAAASGKVLLQRQIHSSSHWQQVEAALSVPLAAWVPSTQIQQRHVEPECDSLVEHLHMHQSHSADVHYLTEVTLGKQAVSGEAMFLQSCRWIRNGMYLPGQGDGVPECLRVGGS